MFAAVWHGPEDIRFETDINIEDPKPDELQIRLKWAGICGTDVHEYNHGPMFICNDKPHPLTGHKGNTILGHEFSGEVVGVGEDVSNFKIGDRITSDIVLYCGECKQCQQGNFVLCEKGASLGLQTAQGGFGEYLNMPSYAAYKLPENVSYIEGATVEPCATGLHALRMGGFNEGHKVAIIGSGAIGFYVYQAAKIKNAGEVYLFTRGEERLKRARSLNCGKVFDSSDKDSICDFQSICPDGVDIVIDCVSTLESMELAMEISAPRGVIVTNGIFLDKVNIDLNNFVFFEKSIIGALGRYEIDMEEAIKFISQGLVKVEPLITKKIKVNEIKRGFEELSNQRGKHIKILVEIKEG